MKISNQHVSRSGKCLRVSNEIQLIMFVAFLCLLLTTAIQGKSPAPQKIGPRDKSDQWIVYKKAGVTYEIALEWVMGNESGPGSKRVVFVYLDSSQFTKDNVLLVSGDIASKIAQPTFLNVTLLTDRALLKARVQHYSGLITSADTTFSRLTGGFDNCCQQNFSGAQFDRYPTEARFLVCINGKSQELRADIQANQEED